MLPFTQYTEGNNNDTVVVERGHCVQRNKTSNNIECPTSLNETSGEPLTWGTCTDLDCGGNVLILVKYVSLLTA